MNDRELMNRFLESGYVINEPNKFYREIRAVGLDGLLNELDNISNETNNSFDYQGFENNFLNYLREIRNIVVNDENYNVVEPDMLSAFTDLLRELGNKYILSNRATEERLNANLDLTAARDELTSLNRELASLEEQLASSRSSHNALRNELIELDTDNTISPIDKTARTFQIMEEVPRLQNEIRDISARIANLREQISNQNRVIENLERSLNEVREVEVPVIDINFQNTLNNDIQRVSNLINESSLSSNTKIEVRRISNNFMAMENIPFANEASRDNSLRRIYDRFGITRTKEYVVDNSAQISASYEPTEEIHEKASEENIEPKEENVIESQEPDVVKEETIEVKIIPPIEKVKSKDDSEIDAIIAEFKNEKAPIDADFDEVWQNLKDDFNKKPITFHSKPIIEEKNSAAKIVTFTGKMHNVTVNPKAFEGLEIGRDYEVEFEDEVNYRLKGFDTSFPKDAFALISNKKEVKEENKSNLAGRIKIVKIEEPAEEEKKEEEKEKVINKPTLKLVFYHNPDSITELYRTNDNMRIGEIYEFDASYENEEFLKLTNGNFYKKEYFITEDEYKKILAERKNNAPKIKSRFKVGEDVVYFDRANLTDKEKEDIDRIYFKNGIKKNTKYKIVKINDDGSLLLEGISASFPSEGFMSGKEYDDIQNIINTNLGNKPVSKENLDDIAKKFKENSELVQYVGPTTERLQNGMLYSVEISFGKGALLVDQFGNQMMIDDYTLKNFKPYKVEKKEALALPEESVVLTEEDLPEVILVEQLDHLDKKSSGIFALGLVGLGVTIFTNPIVGAAALPMLLSSLGVSTLGVISKSKFVKSFYTSKMYHKVKKAIENQEDYLNIHQDLTVDELAEIKGTLRNLNNSLNEIKKICEENGLTSKIL